jgi:hypothetical protein
MTTATVFVDDAVQGHLPMVCVRTGEPADGLHRIHTTIGGSSGWIWLLIFLGPFGWMFLIAALVLSGRSRELLVRLPYSNAALDRERREFRAAVVAGAVMMASVTGMIVALAGSTPRSQVAQTVLYLLIGASVISALATFVMASQYSTHRPGIVLDASGRWVNLQGVHANFARAVADRSARVAAHRS